MPRIARLITTFKCNRNCSYCVNKTSKHLIDSATIINNINELSHHDIVCITGGEPMLKLKETIKIIKKIKEINNKALIYIYSALWRGKNEEIEIIKLIDGIHFTLHFPLDKKDVIGFQLLQNDIEFHGKGKSFRLFINSDIKNIIKIRPNLWKRVEVKPYINDCQLPDGEKLYILKEK